ncbi:helix-turn-helix domain-containing protein [Burkholderia sp. PU8-34]
MGNEPTANDKFAARLREMRTEQSMSREMLAEKASISRNTLYLVEEGKTNVRLLTIRKLASALDVHPSAFFDDGDRSLNGCSPDDFTLLVSTNIKALRQKHGWSQNELSKRSQLPKGYVSQIERRHPDLTLPVMENIAASLGVSIGSLLVAGDGNVA